MISSMTAFAAETQQILDYNITVELRSVNGRGLDIKLRLPEWIDGLENTARKLLNSSISRGNVSLTVRVSKVEDTISGVKLNTEFAHDILKAHTELEDIALSKGLTLAPSCASDFLAMRGILEYSNEHNEYSDPSKILPHVIKCIETVLENFISMRKQEGAQLKNILINKINKINLLIDNIENLTPKRIEHLRHNFIHQVDMIKDKIGDIDPNRLAQETALAAIKLDITEEIDRLKVHVIAAQDLLNTGGQIGRKFDFLAQEFNREANTICSKAQYSALTQLGLELKVVIDQIREQIQNVE